MKKRFMALTAVAMTAAMMIAPAVHAADEISFWNIATDEPDKTIWSYAVDKYNALKQKEAAPTSTAIPSTR